MGGMNHQPCRSYLMQSTLLSRSICVAFINLEQANVSLEDIIIVELGNETSCGTVKEITSHLEKSKHELLNSNLCLDNLIEKMNELQFQDLPSLKSMSLRDFGTELVRAGMVNDQSWREVSTIMSNGGFYLATKVIKVKINNLISLTDDLICSVAVNEKHANEGKLNLVLEENLEGNFKVKFAQLYQGWSEFQQFFLASSMCSTELWYRFNNFGSLLLSEKELLKAG